MDVKTLDEIKDLREGKHVNVMGKIQSIEPVEKVIIKTGTEEERTLCCLIVQPCVRVWHGKTSLVC